MTNAITQPANLWDRQPGESKGAFQAFNDYKNMGGGRSIEALYKYYNQLITNESPIVPPTTKKYTLDTWSLKKHWVKRAEAWDEHLRLSQNHALTLTVEKLLNHELEDYERQRSRWVEIYEQTPLFKQTVETRTEADGKEMTVVTVKMNTAEYQRLAKWREQISYLGRRALGMPERITKQEYDKSSPIDSDLDTARAALERLITNAIKRTGADSMAQQSNPRPD